MDVFQGDVPMVQNKKITSNQSNKYRIAWYPKPNGIGIFIHSYYKFKPFVDW